MPGARSPRIFFTLLDEAGHDAGRAAASRLRLLIAGILIQVLLATTPVFALDPAKAITQYIHDVWKTEQGLPQNSVQAICQTRDGYLWLGTQEGLVRFDGVRFTIFDKENTPALTHNWIAALHGDREGSLWIGMRAGGLSRLKDGKFTSFTTKDGLSDDRVRVIYQDREGNVWIGTAGGGLNRFKDGKFAAFTTKDGLSNEEVVAIHEDREGSLWIGTFGGGLNKLRDGKFTAYTTKHGLSADRVSAIHEDREGSLWIGTYGGGLSRFRDGKFTTFTSKQGLSSDQVWSIHEDRDGSLWIGTDEAGLNRFRDGRFTSFTSKQGLSNDHVMSIYEDREGSLWIGTAQGGLNRLGEGKFAVFSTKEGLSGDVVLSVYEDRKGNLWIGTDGGGLNRLRDGRITAFTTREGLSNDQVVSIHEDREGSLWVGTFGGGLNRFKDGKFTALTTKDGLSSDVVVSISEDHEGSLWIGTDSGLNRLINGRLTTFKTKDGLSSDLIVPIHEDREGSLWIGTQGGGLNRLRDGKFTAFTTKDGLSNNNVVSIYEDGEGSLWIGTSGGGLNRLRDGKFEPFTAKSGLFDDRIFLTLEDELGNLWMSCNRGIFRASKSDLDAYAEGKLERIPSPSYGTADGMRSAECNGENQPAGWKTRDGRLWFPTINGVAVIDPAHIPINRLPPPLVLEEVLVDGKPLSEPLSPLLVLPPGSRKVDLRYTALSFTAPQRVRFQYRLDGFDQDWVDVGTERTAHYTSLPPGTYTFRVKACNGDGIWNETGVALELRLLPFFYQTRTFQALCGLGLVLLGAAAQRLRIQRLKARAQELERIVAEQTRDLRTTNEELRQAQDQLARLSEATPEKLENVSAWGTSMADQVARAIRAQRLHLWRADGESLVPLSPGAARPPTWEALQAARVSELGSADGATIVPVTGMTDELRGAIVIEGAVAWGDTERRLVTALAQHLGSALDLQHFREQLTVTEARQVEMRQRMRERGVHTLKLCPRCGRCYDESVERCEADQTRLDGSRLLPYRILERYRLTFLLGEGGMGSVFEAHDEKLRRDVALKVIRAEALSDAEVRFRLEREAQVLARINHPSVIGLFDSGELEGGAAFLVMELLSGRDLAYLLSKHGPGTPAQAAILLRQVGPALKAAHLVGVIHRDVKPANIFLEPAKGTFQSKVLDFGLAKSTRAEARLTQSGMLVGTPAYMSPEQVEGRDIDTRTDVYSLAVVAYEVLTGRQVVPGNEVGRMLVDVLYTTPPKLSSLMPGLPAEVDRAFEAALAKRPADRPTDIEVWAEGLAALLETVGGAASGWPLDLLTTPRKREPASKPGETRAEAVSGAPRRRE